MRDGHRVKVIVHCEICGETFILRGKKGQNQYSTGFKSCLCDNQEHFKIEVFHQ